MVCYQSTDSDDAQLKCKAGTKGQLWLRLQGSFHCYCAGNDVINKRQYKRSISADVDRKLKSTDK